MLLTDCAFGARPDAWPLPPATTAEEHWHRAVAAGGQGHYGAALADLETLARLPASGALRSLGLSTRASFLRQLGHHGAARVWDGRAWGAVAADPDAAPDAAADALVGLAADALGVGRFALSARLLHRAAPVVERAQPRAAVRWGWVSAELAMATGQGAAAVGHAERAVGRAGATGSTRHAVKSEVVLAAALCCSGELDASRRVAEAALGMAERHGLVPLTWALASLLGDIGGVTREAEELRATRERSAAVVRHRGGTWAVR
ncbi:hypothetical protein [Mycolicibacterium grossiae]|uniref:MalT-like TPR region domain-containing protein n=1 Tax=Mycolicibacterium grossiae TaxID=1552759 RepID=A0A1E8PX77_9MYCO|nr:hypothetical protein [Mycolicibacterium grossiae]OFJ50284.1 hypothetical protein BEL07_29130 [Mycolicibacterium grossiae]QEM45389.1 hypothetical protein FZ046_11925 [Mycolicibacterium grossiae]